MIVDFPHHEIRVPVPASTQCELWAWARQTVAVRAVNVPIQESVRAADTRDTAPVRLEISPGRTPNYNYIFFFFFFFRWSSISALSFFHNPCTSKVSNTEAVLFASNLFFQLRLIKIHPIVVDKILVCNGERERITI